LIEPRIIGRVGLIDKDNLPAHRRAQFNLDKMQNLNKIRKITAITAGCIEATRNA
jgi:hypothetical protein